MKFRLGLCFAVLFSHFVYAVPMWESGELTYPNGATEVSAFVNTKENMQLQSVLCTKNESYAYRFSLLLPHTVSSDLVIQVHVRLDSMDSTVYAEVNGNSLDFQIDNELLVTMPDTTSLSIAFTPDDAAYLGVPEVLDVPMSGADLTFRKVASDCTARCINNGFQCDKPLVSSVLWPRDFYRGQKDPSVDYLCVSRNDGTDKFTLTDACKLALDRFYIKNGEGPLSFLYQLFNNKDSLFQKYQTAWNEAVENSPSGALRSDVYADGREWYLILYSLAGSQPISAFPNSYHEVLNLNDDPTTLIYNIDNRYEMEALKYASVLYRRLQSSVRATELVDGALKSWSDFYRELQQVLPLVSQTQALRPVIYRAMLLRIWDLAGRPQGITLKPENAFRQATGGRTNTGEYLEAVCSLYDGANRDEFFFASEDCVRAIDSEIRVQGLKTEKYEDTVKSWDDFSSAWMKSQYYSDSLDDAVGEHHKSNLELALLSLFKTYGFGDYFLLRECLASRDPDICGYEAHRYFLSYRQELENRINSIKSASNEDAWELKRLNDLWEVYYQKLTDYVNELVALGKIPLWRAEFVRGVAAVTQTNALLNVSYDHEETMDDFENEPYDQKQLQE